MLTLNVYEGDLGIDDGTPTSVYTLDPTGMTQLTGGKTGVDSIELTPGETAELPNGLGTVTFEDDVADAGAEGYEDSRQAVRLASTSTTTRRRVGARCSRRSSLGGLLTSLFVPRRRIWVKAADGPTAASARVRGARTRRGPGARRRGRGSSPTAHGEPSTAAAACRDAADTPSRAALDRT